MFDMSILEVGDVIHFNYGGGQLEKGLIANIDWGLDTSKREYTVVYSTYSVFINESELIRKIVKCAYRIAKPLAGLELI